MPNNTLGAEGRCGHVYPNGRTCGFPPGSHHGDGCQHHPFTPPVKSESVNGEAVNVAAEAQGGACCNKAVERFVAEVRERSRRRQVEVETDHAMRPGSLERFEVDGITGEAFDEVCSERNIK
jgi:hypothetical protein